jgi:HD-GYP domain-containing protein (c-di-GMP phosphodiesterase class II)
MDAEAGLGPISGWQVAETHAVEVDTGEPRVREPGSPGLAETLLPILHFKSRETAEHSHRVGRLAAEWVAHLHSRGRHRGVDLSEVSIAARFHDIGKIGIPDSVLNKAGALDVQEWEWMRQHARIGYELFDSVSSLKNAALGVLHHHERWDGAGYPAGLKGEGIPLIARIIAIIDAFDAMTHTRSYQSARTESEALQEIHLRSGTQFCPDLAREFAQFLNARNT